MKRRSITRMVSAAVVSAAMLLAATPVLAAGSNYSTTIEGTKTTTFDKYLVMDQYANVPNASFTYAVTAGTAQTYDVDDKTFEVLAGVDADKVTITDQDTATAGNQLVFAPTDTTKTDENASVKGYDKDTQKYAMKTATVDFSAVTFTEPGVYRYVITESGTNQGVTNDTDLTRALDVYVQDASTDTEKKLTIAGYVLHSGETATIAIGENNQLSYSGDDTKKQGFTNTYDTSNLTFRKEVSGNQASHDKYFAFTVTISGAVPGTKYTVDLTNADTTSGSNAATITDNQGKTNPTELVAVADSANPTNGTVTETFYLQHGQEITIKGLAKDTTYTVTENAEDYTSTAAGVEGYTDATNGSIVSTDIKTSYLNTRNGIIPTGVLMTVAPFAVITLVGGCGVASVLLKRKKKDDEA